MIETLNRIFIEITTEYNLKCQFCKLWNKKEKHKSLSTERKLKFLEELLVKIEKDNINKDSGIQITLTGGETFMKSGEIFKISELCRDHGVQCYTNTNGTLVKGLEKEILKSGLTAIAFSIDSYTKNIHDRLRNKTGLFSHVINEIKDLIKKKDQSESNLNICIQSILGSWNMNDIENHISFFEKLNVDGISFQPIQYPFGLPIPENWYKEYKFFPKSHKEVNKTIEYLIGYKEENNFLLNSIEEIKLWESYFINPEFIEGKNDICGAHAQNIILDVYGNVKFCFNKELEPLNYIGNIKTHNLEEILHGDKAIKVKKEMKQCTRSCGIMACHINQDIKKY